MKSLGGTQFRKLSVSVCGLKSTGMDSSVCFLDEQGRVLFFAEDERFNRHKHGWDIESPAYQWFMRHKRPRNDFPVVLPISDFNLSSRVDMLLREGLTLEQALPSLEVYQRRFNFSWNVAVEVLGIHPSRVFLYPHHLCHAASAFYPSGFEQSAILVFDGQAETECMSLGTAKPGSIDFFHKQPFTHSLGKLYSKITDWLGLGDVGSEWKTMGLAPYGEPAYKDLFLSGKDGIGPVLSLGSGPFDLRVDFENFLSLFGSPDRVGAKPTRRQSDIAATIQALTEDYVLEVVKGLKKETGSDRLCYAGGMAYNVRVNQKIIESGLFKEVYVFPAAGDSGTSLGGAFHHYHVEAGGKAKVRRLPSMYTGPGITPAQARQAAEGFGLPFSKPEDLAGELAARLARGEILGLARGNMESGPRALGHRSILADPRRADARDRINSAVKYREWWRPFAPIVLAEEVERFFDPATATPYMITTSPATAEGRRAVPAVVHVDGTSRLQVVTRESDPFLHKLLLAFKEITGVGVLLNTSFNLKGEPIVRTAQDALDTFVRCQLDAVAVANLLVERPDGGVRSPKDTRLKPQLLSLSARLPGAARVLVVSSCGPEQLLELTRYLVNGYGAGQVDVLLPAGQPETDLPGTRLIRFPAPKLLDWFISGFKDLEQALAEPYDLVLHAIPESGWYYYSYFKKYRQEMDLIKAIRLLEARRGKAPRLGVCPAWGVSHNMAVLDKLMLPVWKVSA